MVIPTIDDRLDQEGDGALFCLIVRFLVTGSTSQPFHLPRTLLTEYAEHKIALDLEFYLDRIYGEPRASFYTLLQVHRVAQSLEIPELATATLTEMLRRAYRVHRELEGVYDQTYVRNNERVIHKYYRPGVHPIMDDRFVEQVGSFVRCLVEIAQAMPTKEVAQFGLSIDVPKDLGFTLVTAAYMLWNRLETDDVFWKWWGTEEGRLFRGLILEHREPGWDFGTWQDWLEM